MVTPLTAPAMDIPGIEDGYLENTPLGRSGEPREIAALLRFLLSDESPGSPARTSTSTAARTCSATPTCTAW